MQYGNPGVSNPRRGGCFRGCDGGDCSTRESAGVGDTKMPEPWDTSLPSLGARSKATSLFSAIVFFLCVLAPPGPAGAIVTANDEISKVAPTGQWDLDWNYVYNYKDCSAVAISPYWLLTASHVADDPWAGDWNMTIGETTYTEIHAVHHKDTYNVDPNHGYGSDLALIRLDTPLPGYYDVYEDSPRYMDAVLVGYGLTGTAYSSSYSWTWGTDGTRRWGTNRVDFVNKTGVHSGMTSDTIRMYYDYSSGTDPYEAGLAVYDSGGGTFVKDPSDDTWKLAGINAYVYSALPSYPGDYRYMDAVQVENYVTWIENILDDPAYYPSILGDANLDGAVDDADFGIVSANWLETGVGWKQGDFNFDTLVDDADFGILAAAWGGAASGFPTNPVPEPATMCLISVGILTILRRRSR